MVSKHCFAAPDAPNVAAVLATRSERDEMVLETADTILTIRIHFVPFRVRIAEDGGARKGVLCLPGVFSWRRGQARRISGR